MSHTEQPARLPTFLVIGAMRAGTTTLHYDLQSHPEVAMSKVKEPNFFAFEGDTSDLPLTHDRINRLRAVSVLDPFDYAEQFQESSGAKAFGDVSPTYLYSGLAARRIKAIVPSVRIVAILRDPVDRAYSQYAQRSDVDPDPDAFVETAEREYAQFEAGTRLHHYPVILGSLYSKHLKSYFDLFPLDQIRIEIYESFWPGYRSALGTIHQFVGVRPLPPDSDQRLNKSGISRSTRLEQLLRGKSSLKNLAKDRLPERVLSGLVKSKAAIEGWILDEPPGPGDSARAYLFDSYFASDIEHVEELIDKDLTVWRS